MKCSLILCEGYQDRAFLSAWIDAIGDREARVVEALKEQKRRALTIKDAHAKQIGDRQLYVVPCGSLEKIAPTARLLTKNHAESVDRLVVVADADGLERREREQRLRASLQGIAVSPQFIVWVPTLEGVIQRALEQARPTEMASVRAFLEKAPAPSMSGKESPYVYCSTWEPDSFGESFYQLMWRRPALRAALGPLLIQDDSVVVSTMA